MKTNYALAAVLETGEPNKLKIVHVCFYEDVPQVQDVNALIEELKTDEAHGLTDKQHNVDYFLEFFEGAALVNLKEDLKIGDEL